MLNFALLHIGKNKAKTTTTVRSELANIDLRYISEIKRRICNTDNPLHRGYNDKYDLDVSFEVDNADLQLVRDYLLFSTVPPKYSS